MPKGEKLRAKAKWISQPLLNLEIVEIEFVFRPKNLLLQNRSLMGRSLIMEKGEFWHLIKFTLEIFLYLLNQVCLT
jgi:hypothetical protein